MSSASPQRLSQGGGLEGACASGLGAWVGRELRRALTSRARRTLTGECSYLLQRCVSCFFRYLFSSKNDSIPIQNLKVRRTREGSKRRTSPACKAETGSWLDVIAPGDAVRVQLRRCCSSSWGTRADDLGRTGSADLISRGAIRRFSTAQGKGKTRRKPQLGDNERSSTTGHSSPPSTTSTIAGWTPGREVIRAFLFLQA